MELTNPADISARLARHDFRFSKPMGQHFLTAAWVPAAIADASGADAHTGVLEVGPGIGCLTEQLAQRAAKVVSVELDERLRPVLAETLAAYPNVELVFGDVLALDLAALCREKFGEGRAVACANLPYYITTPAITALMESGAFEHITVMVQKEVAERMQARPKEKEYGALSIAVQYYCDAKLDMIVQPACFMPRPKVASAVITLKVLPERKVKTADEKLFFHLVKCAFGQRRKTLMNCLFHLGNLGFSKEELAELLEELGWDTRVRGEALGLEEFAALTDKIAQKKASI